MIEDEVEGLDNVEPHPIRTSFLHGAINHTGYQLYSTLRSLFFDPFQGVQLPPWLGFAVAGGLTAAVTFSAAIFKPDATPYIRVAFVGNSMMYYNDLPRFMETLSDHHISQDSCLHGGASLKSLLVSGNGMYNIWSTGSARVDEEDGTIHDFGACSVKQLLLGYDYDLETQVEQLNGNGADDIYYEDDVYNGDDFSSYFDGSNPCIAQPLYYDYLQEIYRSEGIPVFDYIVINDNTRSPARYHSRKISLEVLEDVYAPLIRLSGATPVFMMTYGYWTPYRDMGALESIPKFTSLTYEGYKQYADVLEMVLPAAQRPRIAPVGLAFLIVWEENLSLWQRLFHVDQIHASPLGTFLEGCVLHHTLLGTMPPINTSVRGDMFTLWMNARRFQPGEHRRTPFPTEEEAAYLYHVAVRVVKYGEMPATLIEYNDGEAANYYPADDLYSIDDLY